MISGEKGGHPRTVFLYAIEDAPLTGDYITGSDLTAHLPRMYSFWSAVVFHAGTYRSRPHDMHLRRQGLWTAHFASWAQRFQSTVDTRIGGGAGATDEAKARKIGTIFQIRLGLEPDALRYMAPSQRLTHSRV